MWKNKKCLSSFLRDKYTDIDYVKNVYLRENAMSLSNAFFYVKRERKDWTLYGIYYFPSAVYTQLGHISE